jgi:hypothetical protein
MIIVVAFDGRALAASDAKAIAEAIKSLFMGFLRLTLSLSSTSVRDVDLKLT